MKLILVELNEINFDIASLYIEKGENLNTLKKLIENSLLSTSSENEYSLLEPWIQWPSIHLGKNFSEHGVYRLGDIVNSKEDQIFEILERNGLKVGAISPMNARNSLKNATYFIPDPWTNTPSDGSFFSKIITQAISQAVNDNAKAKLKVSSIMGLFISFVFLVSLKGKIKLTYFALSSIFKSWRKALFLDLFLHEVHKNFLKNRVSNFSTIFFNAGAHIQHHYFFNSKVLSNKFENPSWYISREEDPVLDMLKMYDKILSELLSLKDTEILIATGLSQKPYDRIKYYYRLDNHELFLKKAGIHFKKIFPRMTRDFLVQFESEKEAYKSQKILEEIKVDNKFLLFEKIDNRGKELFITLTFPFEINKETKINLGKDEVHLEGYVSFVSIKNSMHQSKGYLALSPGLRRYDFKDGDNVSNIHNLILKFFRIESN